MELPELGGISSASSPLYSAAFFFFFSLFISLTPFTIFPFYTLPFWQPPISSLCQ